MLNIFLNLEWKERRRVWKYFTIIFFSVLLISLLPFLFTGSSFLVFDFFSQHVPFLEDILENLSAMLRGDMYSFNLGMGEDMLTSYTYYGLFDPFVYICALFPLKYIEFSYMFVCLLKFYSCGVSFMLLAKHYKMKPASAIISSLIYSFGGFIVFTALKHPFFMTSPFLLPLLILGLERFIEEDKKLMLVIVVFYNAIANFYLFFANVVCVVIYYLVRRYYKSEKYFDKKFFYQLFSLGAFSFLGVMCASFVLVPNIHALLNGARLETKGFAWFSLEYYYILFVSFIAPVVGLHYTAYTSNLIVIILLPLLFSFKDKRHFITLNIIFIVCLFIPLFGYFMNMMSYVNNRWNYITVFFLALNGGFILDEIDTAKPNKKVIYVLLGYIGLYGITALAFSLYLFFNPLYRSYNTLIAWAILFSSLLAGVLGYVTYKKLPGKKILNRQRLSVFFVSTIVLQNLIFYSCMIHTYPRINAYNLAKSGEIDQLFTNLDQDFYRIAKRTKMFNRLDFSNDGVVYNYPSNFYYNTMVNSSILDFLSYTNCISTMNTVGYEGFDNRAILDSLSSVRYYALREEEKQYLPYGYQLKEEHEVRKYLMDTEEQFLTKSKELTSDETTTIGIYENQYFLPLGYAYDSYILTSQVGDDYLTRMQTMLNTAIVDEEFLLDKYTLTSIDNTVNYSTDFSFEKQSKGDEDYIFEITLEEDVTNAEIYLDYHLLLPEELNSTTTHQLKEVTKTINQWAKGWNFYEDNTHRFTNLGYYQNLEKGSKISIAIESLPCQFELSDLRILKNDMDLYKQGIENLVKMHSIEFQNDSTITGKIDLVKDSIVTFSIPYSEGWKVELDGREVDTTLVNHGLMGIYAPSGQHQIKLTYTTPLLKQGMYLSISAFLALATYFVIKDIKRRRNGACKYPS